MKRRMLIAYGLLLAMLAGLLGGCNSKEDVDVFNEGEATLIEKTSWTAADGTAHTADFYTFGKTATEVAGQAGGIELKHIWIDDIPVYEMVCSDTNTGKMIFFFHGQNSRKEEYLYEMLNYAEAGYYCVTVDLRGHGERITEEAVMSVQITVETAKDIDVLLDYYGTIPAANEEKFALLGLSQGGGVSYWYAAYGKRKPSALVIGSSTPDYQYQDDANALQNGNNVDGIWSDAQLQGYIDENNPINNLERFIDIPTLSGNGLKDAVISYKGAEALEKAKFDAGYTNSQFFYFENLGHEVTEDFMMRVLGFLNKSM